MISSCEDGGFLPLLQYMPYSIRGSQTYIYPGTICQLSMSAQTQAQLSMSTLTQALTQSMPNQWAFSQIVCFNEGQLSITTGTQALNLLMPNQWARSHKLLISIGSSWLSILTNWHDFSLYVSTRNSYQCQQGHKLLIYRCQTNGHDLLRFWYWILYI